MPMPFASCRNESFVVLLPVALQVPGNRAPVSPQLEISCADISSLEIPQILGSVKVQILIHLKSPWSDLAVELSRFFAVLIFVEDIQSSLCDSIGANPQILRARLPK